MNRQTRTLVSALMMLIMIGVALLPGAMGEPVSAYTVTVSSGQSTSITNTNNVSFGSLVPGTDDNEIENSFSLTNVGNTDCTVSATFNTNTEGIYGLTNASTYVIGGGNFSMNNTGGDTPTYVDLNNLVGVTSMTTNNDVEADAVADVWSVTLDIPSGQYAAIYSGTVELTFANTGT